MARTPRGQARERVYRFVQERLLAGSPPTVREVQEALGFSAVQSAQAHLAALIEEGRLVKEEGQSRGYRLPGKEASAVALVPILGRVQAGALSVAVEDVEGYLNASARSSKDEVFALRVRGESMLGAGILPGDLVVVRRQPSAASGDIVVALVGDEATVKRLRLRQGRTELHPENPAFEPIRFRPEELQILGKVIEVRRHLEPISLGAGALE